MDYATKNVINVNLSEKMNFVWKPCLTILTVVNFIWYGACFQSTMLISSCTYGRSQLFSSIFLSMTNFTAGDTFSKEVTLFEISSKAKFSAVNKFQNKHV